MIANKSKKDLDILANIFIFNHKMKYILHFTKIVLIINNISTSGSHYVNLFPFLGNNNGTKTIKNGKIFIPFYKSWVY